MDQKMIFTKEKGTFFIQTRLQTRLINYEKAENQRRVELQTFHLREINMTKDLIT